MKQMLLAAISCLLFTSCTRSIMKLYGMNDTKHVNEALIVQYAEEYNIPLEDTYELDTAYSIFLFSLDNKLYKTQIKNHFQPLQVQYFDRLKQLRSFQINCYADGSPNLNWNRDSILSTFPPKQQAPIDSLVSLATQLSFIRPLSKTTTLLIENYDYIILVYWNRFMGRQSERLIRFVQNNCKLAGDKKVKIIYVNNDNIYAKVKVE